MKNFQQHYLEFFVENLMFRFIIYLDHLEAQRKHMHSFCLRQTSLKYVNKHRDRKFYRTEYKVAEIKVLRIPSLVQIVNTIKIQVMLSFNSQNFT